LILPDVNLLVYAVDETGPWHDAARTWWENTLNASTPVALCYASILDFIRLTTNARIFQSPLGVDEALEIVESWLERPNTRLISPGIRH